MKFRNVAAKLIVSGALLSVPVSLQAAERSQTDILLDVLVRKGVLSSQEASEVRQEVAQVAAAEQAQIVETATKAASKSVVPMPKALDGLKLFGDARFRFQGEHVDGKDRSRWRYRARFGAQYDFRESPFSMGMRMETADANDSTNANFGGFFDKVSDELFLGQLYLKYAGENTTVLLGKHSQPFMIDGAWWDSDINPEGLSEIFEAGDWTFAFGQYVIDEEREDKNGAGNDDFLFVAQAQWSDGENLTIAPFAMMTTDGASIVSENSGSFSGENAIKDFRDFFVVALPAEYGFKGGNGVGQKLYGTVGMNLEGGDAVERMGSPFYSAADVGDQNLFFNLGYQYGSAKKAGTWQAGIEYRYIEGAALTPNLFDSDFAKNSTNHAGFLLSYKYAVTDFFQAGITYMNSDTIDEDYAAPVVAKQEAQLLQVDAAVKF